MNLSGQLLLSSDLARRIFGIRADVGGKVDSAQIYFGGGLPVVALAAIILVACVWFGVLYIKDGTRPSLLVKSFLLSLRMVAVGALLVMLLQPMLRLIRSQEQRSNVVLLVDTSQSMAFIDKRLPADRAAQVVKATGANPSQLSRAEIVERIANSPQTNALRTLLAKYNVRVYGFDSEASPQSLPPQAKEPGNGLVPLKVAVNEKRGVSTQMGIALKKAMDDTAGQPIAGALFLSDGGNNLGDDPVATAQASKAQGLKVSALGVGDPTPTKDLAITEVLADQVVRKDNSVQAFAGIEHRGYEGQSVTVTLKRGGETVGTQVLRLGPSGRKQTVNFLYRSKVEGAYTYTATVTSLGGEITYDNNKRNYLQRTTSKRLKILYVEGEPRWEYRYLKNAILRDPQIAFSSILVSSPSMTTAGGEGNIPIYKFPDDEKSLFEYDIVILGDVPRIYFSETQIRNLRRFVEDKGSSLMIVAGEKHVPQEYRGSLLEPVMPVVIPPFPEPVRMAEPFQWELTPEGRNDPLLRMADDATENGNIWKSLPGMYWHAGVPKAKPGATVLAVNATRSNSFGKRVVLAVQPFGAGRCLMSLSDSTWRWRYRVGDRYFYRYWGQVIRTLTPQETPGGNRFAQVNANRPEYQLGERVSIFGRLLDAYYRPIKDKQVVGVLRGETGAPVNITLNAVPGSPGLFTAEFMAERTGKFQFSLASSASPGALANTNFLVQSVALEQQQPEMNEKLLQRIASAGGGAYYRPDQLKNWIDSLRADTPVVKSESEIELFDAPLLLTLFVAPLGLEWFLRKKTGLL